MLVTGSLLGGGAERQLSEMANHWSEQGALVTLATWSGPATGDFYPLDARIERRWLDVSAARRGPLAALAASRRRIRRLRSLLEESAPDAVLSFIDVSNIHTVLAARGLAVRVVIAERTHPAVNRTVSRPWRALRRILYRRANVVVAQTRDAAEWLERACGTPVQVIPNFLRDLPPAQGPREPLILAVGRLSAEKGFDLLLKGFAALAARFPGWRVCIIGEGVERGALHRLARALGIEERVEFTGEVRGTENWMARASLLVHPSRREGFPNVVLEAMGMGLPVLCTNCRAGPSDLIQDGINGRLVPVDDLDALTRAMRELMEHPELREQLGLAATSVRGTYGRERIMRRWEGCLLGEAEAAPRSRRAGPA